MAAEQKSNNLEQGGNVFLVFAMNFVLMPEWFLWRLLAE